MWMRTRSFGIYNEEGMLRRLFLMVVVAVVVALHSASAAPSHPDPKAMRNLFTNQVNNMLQDILGKITEPVVPKGPIEIRVNQNHVAHIYLRMDNSRITGLKDFAAHDCTLNLNDFPKFDVTISIKSPKVTITTDHYFINGSMVDHIELVGEGPGLISVDDMDVKVEGSGHLVNDNVELTSATLDLEMWRWTVNLEDMMPGTDLGTVFNEFFTMYGPEIFDIVENNINNSGNLVNIINNLLNSHNIGRYLSFFT